MDEFVNRKLVRGPWNSKAVSNGQRQDLSNR
jgi:hypothetical protein